jgi:hypothetical protein
VLALLSKMNTMVLAALCLAYELTWAPASALARRRRDGAALALAALVGWLQSDVESGPRGQRLVGREPES